MWIVSRSSTWGEDNFWGEFSRKQHKPIGNSHVCTGSSVCVEEDELQLVSLAVLPFPLSSLWWWFDDDDDDRVPLTLYIHNLQLKTSKTPTSLYSLYIRPPPPQSSSSSSSLSLSLSLNIFFYIFTKLKWFGDGPHFLVSSFCSSLFQTSIQNLVPYSRMPFSSSPKKPSIIITMSFHLQTPTDRDHI